MSRELECEDRRRGGFEYGSESGEEGENGEVEGEGEGSSAHGRKN